MKNLNLVLLALAICIMPAINLSGQPDWNTNGNTINGIEWFGADATSLVPIRFQHQANGAQSRFEWWTNNGTLAERMRLNQQGWLGLNTSTSLCGYHQNLGDFLIVGLLTHPATATVPLPTGAEGDRLMWIESRGAFRAGWG